MNHWQTFFSTFATLEEITSDLSMSILLPIHLIWRKCEMLFSYEALDLGDSAVPSHSMERVNHASHLPERDLLMRVAERCASLLQSRVSRPTVHPSFSFYLLEERNSSDSLPLWIFRGFIYILTRELKRRAARCSPTRHT